MNIPPNRPAGKTGPLDVRWQSISVRPWSLMKLRHKLNPQFPAGAIVALSNELVADYSTPTKYEGQGSPNLNASTRVRVFIWHKDTSTVRHPSQDGGKPFSIQHKHLIDSITRSRKSHGGWETSTLVKLSIPPTGENDVTYMTAKYPKDDPRGVLLRIPNGTVGVVTKCMTGTNRAMTPAQQRSSNRTDWWYVIEINVVRTQWGWYQCQEHVSVLALDPLTDEEENQMNDFIRRTSGPPQLSVTSRTNPNA